MPRRQIAGKRLKRVSMLRLTGGRGGGGGGGGNTCKKLEWGALLVFRNPYPI